MDLHLPQNETEAEWMQKAGYRWIADNAPHKLTDLAQELAAANKAIVALASGMEQLLDLAYIHGMSSGYADVFKGMMKDHTPAIEKARGG